MKSLQPAPVPNTSQPSTEATSTAPRLNNSMSGTNDTRGAYQAPGFSRTNPPPYPSVPFNTFLTPGPSIQAYPPQYSSSPGFSPPWIGASPERYSGDYRGASPNASAMSWSGPFAPKTAAELGLSERLDTSYEGLELSNIVDRLTASFPLDVQSGSLDILKTSNKTA